MPACLPACLPDRMPDRMPACLPCRYVELAWIVSVLSAGPVGVGDIVNNTNKTLLMTACAQDGRLLKASTPSTYVPVLEYRI